MTTPSIAFFDIPYHSRLVTTLPLLRALVKRGHQVYGFTLPPYRTLLACAGAQVEEQPPFSAMPPECTVNLRCIEYSMEAVPQLIERLSVLQPALVLLTAKCLWAAIAAERCGIPTAVVHTNALWPRGMPVSEAVYAARWPDKPAEVLARIEARDRAAWERCQELFQIAHIPTEDVLPGLPNCMNLRGALNLVYTSAALQPQRQAFDETFHFVGPCYDDRPADADPDFDAALGALPRPLIYVALGSMRSYNDRANIFRTALAAFADGRFGVVMAVGSQETVTALSPQAPHVLLRPYVPQLSALAQTSVFLTHAGTNSVYESLLGGVPMLMLPQGGDQPIMAEHIAQIGLGYWLREADLSPQALRAHAEALRSDQGLLARVRAAGAGLRAAGGTEHAAQLLSDFAAQRRAAA
jgi:MGT family glycosyltransferase